MQPGAVSAAAIGKGVLAASAIVLCLLMSLQPGQAADSGITMGQSDRAAVEATGHTVIPKRNSSAPGIGAPTVAAGKSDLAVAPPADSRRSEASAPAAPGGKSWTPRLIDVAVSDGQVQLNSYRTTTMPLDDLACAELGDDLIDRLRLSAGAVQHLADNDLMRQTRVCAANGTILITCYNQTATVSLRRSSPDDGCGG